MCVEDCFDEMRNEGLWEETLLVPFFAKEKLATMPFLSRFLNNFIFTVIIFPRRRFSAPATSTVGPRSTVISTPRCDRVDAGSIPALSILVFSKIFL